MKLPTATVFLLAAVLPSPLLAADQPDLRAQILAADMSTNNPAEP